MWHRQCSVTQAVSGALYITVHHYYRFSKALDIFLRTYSCQWVGDRLSLIVSEIAWLWYVGDLPIMIMMCRWPTDWPTRLCCRTSFPFSSLLSPTSVFSLGWCGGQHHRSSESSSVLPSSSSCWLPSNYKNNQFLVCPAVTETLETVSTAGFWSRRPPDL